jgi:hypothetical protein
MTTKDFPVFDADSHVVEPPALWEKYLDPVVRGKQDENSASIGVRKCRRMRDERRAPPD